MKKLLFKEKSSYFWSVFIFVYLLLSVSKFILPATDRDEARFAQASKQMIESGDYTQVKFLDQPRHKKPIGVYWIQASTTKLMTSLGVSEGSNNIWTYRLPGLLFGFFALIAFFRLFSKVAPPASVAGATALLGVSALLAVESHLAKADTLLLFFIILQQGALAIWYDHQMKGKAAPIGILLLLWFSVGMGVFIKGPVSPFIFLLTVLTLKFCFKQPVRLGSLKWGVGLVILSAINIPWFWMVQSQSGGAYAAHAIGVDFLPKLLSGQESHGFYPGYYTLLSPILMWPGSFFVIATVGSWKKMTHHPMVRFALAWLIPAWICFELIPTKLPHYVLPLLPAAFLLAALTWRDFGEKIVRLAIFKLAQGVLALILFVLAVAASALLWQESDFPVVLKIAGISIFLVAFIFSFVRFLKHKTVFNFLIFPTILYVFLFAFVLPNCSRLWFSEKLHAFHQKYTPDKKIQVVGFNEPSLFFVTGTQTKSVTFEQALQNLKKDKGYLTVIPKISFEDFKHQMQKRKIGKATPLIDKGFPWKDQQPELMAFKSFNYSKGKKQTFIPVVLK